MQNTIATQNLVETISLTNDPVASKALVKKLKALTKENEKLQRDLTNVKDEVHSKDEFIDKIDDLLKVLHDFGKIIDKCSLEERQELLRSFIRKIYWDGRSGELGIELKGSGC